MSKIKKEVIVILFFILTIVISISAIADEVGCCTNQGAGALTCSTERLVLRDSECCPTPESSFKTYYKSPQNQGPTNYNDCSTNFFFVDTDCSTIDACALGCCCTELGGTIKPQAQCKGSGQTFYKGETDCEQVCAVPACNDGIDNDKNGCADFVGGDLGCASSADKEEAGGSCITQGVGCTDAKYVPKLSNFIITPLKGEKKFLLIWKDECSESAVSYDISRCKGSSCINFVLIATTNTDSFEDASEELLFDTIYTYQVKARYSLQNTTPTITGTGTLGNIDCLGRYTTDIFCFNNSAYYCDLVNKLIAEGTKCSPDQVCIVSDNKPSCIDRINCNYAGANPFGLYYTLQDCETDKYCFYDRSHSIINSCFSCDPAMTCYDYRTKETCARDNCRIGHCKWKNLAIQLGIGVCVSTNQYNCLWCDKKGTPTLESIRAYNEVFDICTKEKSQALSEGSFNCYFRNGKSKNCNNIVCTDYDTSQCSIAQITHDENNKITNPSNDRCSIKVCQNINNLCVKNADGDAKADCSSKECENDYFAPNTTLLPIIRKGVIDSLVIQIYDRTSANGSLILKASQNYATFLCVEPCGTDGHPYNASTKSRKIVISNLNAFDSGNGSKILSFKEGTNTIRYYSQDPSKNIEEVKKIIIEAHSNTSGPKVFTINVTDGREVNDKIYTSNQKPTIDIQFFETAIVTLSRLINNKTGLIVSFQPTKELNNKISFIVTDTLPNGEYIFELNAKNEKNIFMDPQFKAIIVIDNSKPMLNITPSNGTVLNTSLVSIKLAFNKEVNLDTVKINAEEIKDLFSTIDNKVFTTTTNLSDGNKNLEVTASDFAKNKVNSFVSFIVDANPTVINLLNPKFGVASKYTFDIVVETDNDADCRYSLDNNFEYEFMSPFTITGSILHRISSFNEIASGDTIIHKLNIRCKTKKYGVTYKSFDISVDSTPPQLISAFTFPNPIIEQPFTTTFSVEADEPVICKYSSSSKEFDVMEGKFEGFDNNTFKTINKQEITVESEGKYLYYVSCKNKAELISNVKEIQFDVDLSIPLEIISHTPEFFNSTNVILAIETNKKAQCQFSETDVTAKTGELFGASGYTHTKKLISSLGKHTYYVVCKDQFLKKFSDVKSIIFTVDVTPPIILSVNDSSTLTDKPEFTWNAEHLRVKWNSIDDESKVSSHLYSLIESGTLNVIVNWTTSYVNNEWIIVKKANGTSLMLTNSNRYFFRVKAQNVVGLSSNISESDGITVDTSLKPINCTNGIKDEKETDIDCGGVCDLCELGKKCLINSDCKVNFCYNVLCTAPKCDDNVKNQEESDIDCGGSCKKCQSNKACNTNTDCESGFCSFGFCKPQDSCFDGKLTNTESDVDCGGACPTKCSEEKHCDINENCDTGLQCVSSTCKKCADNDKDCNGVPDDQESKEKDTDGDGMLDDWEIQHGLNPNDPSDARLDTDNDGLTNIEEYNVKKIYGKSTDPNNADTDSDGFTDKRELDKGTNPTDPEDFPKSSLTKIILFVLGILVLLSGFSYLAYRSMQKKKKERFMPPKPKELPRTIPQQPVHPLKQKAEELKLKEALKKKEEEKEKARKKLFETFGKEEKEKPKEINEEKPKEEVKEIVKKPTIKEFKGERIRTAKKATKTKSKKPKDVFVKLKEFAKETKKRKLAKRKNVTK